MYRINVDPEVARAMFLTYVTYLNNLKDHPEWYNELTRNCTTTLQKPLAANVNNPQPWTTNTYLTARWMNCYMTVDDWSLMDFRFQS